MEITFYNEGRVRNKVDPEGVRHSHAPQGLHLLSDAGADAEGLGGVVEKLFLLELLEEAREDWDLAVPIARGPYLAELGVEGLVELVLYVGVVGGVAGSDFDAGNGGGCVEGGGRRLAGLWLGEEVEEEEEGDGEEEGDEEAPEDE
ncbi:hypothetical protein PIB30_010341 [Stylosanthes scabra]|uniref:Uncharacterized protein n=1 Tax=Stylosanthes scabra TaxID=79078 RepID=A0ABU6V796_9FABA|nr:hypothetical protein [Stylosanthes scabra]